MSRIEWSELIFDKILNQEEALKAQFDDTKNQIGYFFIDDLLPEDIVFQIQKNFPNPSQMMLKKSLAENKYVAAQMNNYHADLEEIVYAFQMPKIVKLIAEICQIEECLPDENLYAGGISAMEKNQFLNPHLDNSHDKDRNLWRVLNLLFYVTPNWESSFGGNLELWPNGLQQTQTTIDARFNRLVVMATHNKSLHSVSPITANGHRYCVSNYYFSTKPLQETDTFHVTSFRGRPEHQFTDLILQCDTFLRMSIRKIFKKGIVENPHVYKK